MINTVQKPLTTPQTNNGFIGYVNGQIQIFPTLESAQQAGATEIEPNYQRYPAETTTNPKSVQQTEVPIQQTISENNIVPSAEAISSTTTSFNTLWILLIIVIVLGMVYGIYYFKKGKIIRLIVK